jgi:hypothetical protein
LILIRNSIRERGEERRGLKRGGVEVVELLSLLLFPVHTREGQGEELHRTHGV